MSFGPITMGGKGPFDHSFKAIFTTGYIWLQVAKKCKTLLFVLWNYTIKIGQMTWVLPEWPENGILIFSSVHCTMVKTQEP